MAGPSFTVGSNTNINELSNFLRSANGDLRGKHDAATGTTTLYIASKPQALLDAVAGRSAERKKIASDGLKEAFARFEFMNAQRNDYSEVGKTSSAKLFSHIQDSLAGTQGGITLSDARSFADAARFVTRSLPQRSQASGTAQAPLPANGPSIRAFGMRSHGTTVTALAGRLAAETDKGALAEEFGDRLANRFRSNNASASSRLFFALSDATTLKGELKAGLHEALKNVPNAAVTEGDLDAFVDKAVDRAAGRVMDNQVVPNTETPTPYKEGQKNLPDIKVGGRVYTPVKLLGVGGYSDVFAYRATRAPHREIAFKVTQDASPEARTEVGKELTAHSKAFGPGSEHVVGLEGAVRLPDGRIGIALEIAPNGNAHEMVQDIKARVHAGPNRPSGTISPAQEKILYLTMLKDMGAGLKHMHAQSSIHRDVKAVNYMIGADGTAKLADFNTSVLGKTGRVADALTFDNPLYKAPEMLRAEDVAQRVSDLARESEQVERAAIERQLKPLLPLADEGVLRAIARGIMEPRSTEIRAQGESDRQLPFFDTAVDVWGVGASALEMFTGQTPAVSRFMSQTERNLVDFGANRRNDPLGTPVNGELPPGAVGTRTGDADVDSLLRELLRPDPRDRLKARQMDRHPAITRAGVGSDEAKALLLAIKSGDPAAIDRASAALEAEM